MAKERLVLRRFDDMHCHFRLSPLLDEVLPFTAQYVERAIVMPNTRPRAILTADDVVWYRGEIFRVLNQLLYTTEFNPLMTIEVRDSTTPDDVRRAHEVGTIAGKVYPRGVTTNSGEGLTSFFNINALSVFEAMQDVGMLLLLHGELDKPRTLVTKREEAFLPILPRLVGRFPRLKIVLEHISTRTAVETVQELGGNVAATITAHHLCTTLNDVIGSGLQPHNACMPMPKDFDDLDALIEAATSGNPKFFLGSDTAPHLREKKECGKGACGVYTAPILPQLLAEIFESVGCLDRLADFATRFGARFYELPLNTGTITLVKEEWTVPDQIRSVVPFRAGTKLQWSLDNSITRPAH